MGFIYSLSMFVDLSFYYAFANLFIYYIGYWMGSTISAGEVGLISLAEIIWFSLLFGISTRLKQGDRKNGIIIVLLFLGFFLQRSISGILFLIPVLLYAARTIMRKQYLVKWSKQADLLNAFWKGYLIFAGLLLMLGQMKLLLDSSALIATSLLGVSMVLLRSLRHGPDVYLNPDFQSQNLAMIGIVLSINQNNDFAARKYAMEYSESLVPAKNTNRIKDTVWVIRVRKAYQKYLKYCMKNGIKIHTASTSQDIEVQHKGISNTSNAQDACEQIRAIYLDARYNHEADRERLAQFRSLYQQIKRED